MSKIYTDKFLLGELIRFKNEFGFVPTKENINSVHSYPSTQAYRNHFGTHNNALIKAGLEINQFRTINITKEFLISELHRFVKENNRNPTQSEMINKNGYPSIRPYITHFGSWDNSLNVAKLYHNNNIKKAKIAECKVMDSLENATHKSNENWSSAYDILCSKGYKVDVKSSKLYVRRNNSFRWQFHLKNNEIADYFFCLGYGYNDDKYENLQRVWKFKNENWLKNTNFITIQLNNLSKWWNYEITLK